MRSSMVHLLKERNFRLFWGGQLLSVIGDQISLTAFPWLVLQLTGSPFYTALAFALQGVPRAIFMLVGGVAVDRLSPRQVLILTNLARLIIVSGLAAFLLLDLATLPLVLGCAFLFGLADAFYYPAEQGIVPSLVSSDDLQAGNALNQMLLQLAIIIGPVVAGLVIAGQVVELGEVAPDSTIGGRYAENRVGLGRAFVIDAVTFALSLVTLVMIQVRALHGEETATGSVLDDIRAALRFVRTVPAMMLAFLGIALLEFFFQAPVFVGLPVLADLRFAEGAAAFGVQVAGYGAGSLIGGITAGSRPPLRADRLVRIMFLIFAWSGLTMGLVVLYEPLWWAVLLFFTAGLGDGFVWVQFVTWLQRLTPSALIGRVMSILMVLSVGLLPVAYLMIGVLLEFRPVTHILVLTSLVIAVASVACALHPSSGRLGGLAEAPREP